MNDVKSNPYILIPDEGAAEGIKITGEDKDQSGLIAKRRSDKSNSTNATSGTKSGRKPLAVKINEAARLISVSPATIRRLVKHGELRVIRKLRHVLIPLSEVEAFVAGNISQKGGR